MRHHMRMHTPPPPPPAPREGAHVHDGFYMRLGTGFGMYREQLENDDDASVHGGDVSGSTIGLASVGEFAIGGTLGRGWVLGGGFYTATLLTGHYRDDNDNEGALPSEMDPDLRDLVVFGPFVDWYPNPRKGFHLQAALGLAALTSRSDGRFGEDDDDDYEAFGAGIVLGVGYEWWIGNEWSLGVLARTQAAGLAGEDNSDVTWVHGASATPSLLLTLTYH
jgi:hypothetical protein